MVNKYKLMKFDNFEEIEHSKNICDHCIHDNIIGRIFKCGKCKYCSIMTDEL